MVSVLVKEYNIGICCFSDKNAVLGSKSKDWWARNHVDISEWSYISTRGLWFQWASTIMIQLSVLVKNKPDFIIISSNVACSRQDIAVKMKVGVKQRSPTHLLINCFTCSDYPKPVTILLSASVIVW